MLVVTSHAAQLVRHLVNEADLPYGSGMRIVVDPVHQSLSMSLASAPQPRDTVVTADEAHVFLTRSVSERLSGSTLRAQIAPTRQAFFLEETH